MINQNFSIKALWTDKVEDAGVNVRVSFFVLIETSDDVLEWHYFGVTEAERPRPHNTDVPVTEHDYVQFPRDVGNLPDYKGAMDYWYQLSIIAGMNSAGVGYYTED